MMLFNKIPKVRKKNRNAFSQKKIFHSNVMKIIDQQLIIDLSFGKIIFSWIKFQCPTPIISQVIVRLCVFNNIAF